MSWVENHQELTWQEINVMGGRCMKNTVGDKGIFNIKMTVGDKDSTYIQI